MKKEAQRLRAEDPAHDPRLFQRLLLELSVRFVHLSPEQVDSEIEGALRSVCEFLDVQRSTIWLRSHSAPEVWPLTHFYEHPDHGVVVMRPDGEIASRVGVGRHRPDVPLYRGKTGVEELFPWAARRIRSNQVVAVNALAELPAAAARDKLSWERYGTRSTLILPLTTGGEEALGILSFATLREERTWTKEVIDSLQLISQVFAHALARKFGDAERREKERQLSEQLEEIRRLKRRLESEVVVLRDEMQASRPQGEFLGASDAVEYVRFRIGQVAPLDTTVLLQGETGTGKNLAAAAIHAQSRRRDRPLVTVSCAALPGNLIESELFGRDRGAFTGADQMRRGRFEIADGSTIFLDEIGDLPLDLQAKLLRVVQSGEFERLGSSKTIKVDVRIIAASNRDLDEAVRAGRFRADLFYRLNVFPITMPPLRERREDIPLLAKILVEKYAKRAGKSVRAIPQPLLKALEGYDWPGNVRELENVIERAVIVSTGPTLKLAESLRDRALAGMHGASGPRAGATLEEVEREHIVRTLAAVGWRIQGRGGAADILGLNPSTLRARMRKLGVRREERAQRGRSIDAATRVATAARSG